MMVTILILNQLISLAMLIKIKKKLIISLMGVDGAGKTTLAKKLNKIFTNS